MFNENPSSGGRVVPRGRTDRQTATLSAILRRRPKISNSKNHNRDAYHIIWKAALPTSSSC